MRTYWLRHPRKFANEYTVGVATTPADGEQYAAEDYKQIDRAYALSLMSAQPGEGQQLYAGASLDGRPRDRLELAREIRKAQS